MPVTRTNTNQPCSDSRFRRSIAPLLRRHHSPGNKLRAQWAPFDTAISVFGSDQVVETRIVDRSALRRSSVIGQPIEPLIRAEDTPLDAVVVIRGGPITADKILEHAARQQAVFTYHDQPMIAISVDLTIEGWTIERILVERMWSRSRYAVSTVGALREAGYELVPTSAAPHYSVVLPDATLRAAASLLELFGPTMDNEYRQRRR